MTFDNTLDGRASYRREVERQANYGGPALKKFVHRNAAMFALPEMTRIGRLSLDWGWDNLAYFVRQQFRQYRGIPFDPRLLDVTIVHTLITPHLFIKHALEGN